MNLISPITKTKLITFALFYLLFSCNNKTPSDIPNTNLKIISSNFLQWWSYHNENITLSSEFIAIDEKSNVIDKEAFLKALMSGNYMPLKLKFSNKSKLTRYKLFAIDDSTDRNIIKTIKSVSNIAYRQFKKEGTNFPDFNFC